MDVTHELTEMARAAGASMTGVCPVDRFEGAPKGHHPRELLPGAKSVFTFGTRLLDRVLEWPELLQGSPLIPEEMRLEVLHALFYQRSGYDIINDRLNHIALRLATHEECPAQALSLLPEADDDRLWLHPVSRTDWAACRQSREALACAGRCLRVCPVGDGGKGGSQAGMDKQPSAIPVHR